MKPNRLSLLALLAVVAGGCAVGPNYERPAVNTPARWSEPLAGGETNAPVLLTGWWKNFHDPELDSLIDRAVQSNLNLRIARARVEGGAGGISNRRRQSLAVRRGLWFLRPDRNQSPSTRAGLAADSTGYPV